MVQSQTTAFFIRVTTCGQLMPCTLSHLALATMQKTIEQMGQNQFVRGKELYKYQDPMAPNAVSVTHQPT